MTSNATLSVHTVGLVHTKLVCSSVHMLTYLQQAPFSCCLQYQFNNRILAAAVARRPATAYELSHAEECASSFKIVPVLYQAAS